MPRTVSSTAKRAVFASQTGEVFVFLLTLAHASLPDSIRVASDAVDVTSRGNIYQRFPFEISTPSESEEAPPQVRLKICNVDRRIVEAVRSVSSAVAVTLELVLASSPDTLEAGPFEFKLRDVTYDALVVEGQLSFEDVLNEPFPADTVTPPLFPGLFR